MSTNPGKDARKDLTSTLTELDERLRPKELAADASASLQRAVTDAVDVVTGKGVPASAPRKRRAIGVLAVGGGIVVVVLSKILRRR